MINIKENLRHGTIASKLVFKSKTTYHQRMGKQKRLSSLSMFDLSLAQCCVGLSIVISKFLLDIIPMMMLMELRFLIGAVFSALFVISANRNPFKTADNRWLNKKDYAILFLQAMCGGFIFSLFMLSGLTYTSASAAGIITSTLPAFILILSFFILGEKITPTKFIAIVITVAGLMVLTIGKGEALANHATLLGDFLILMAVIPEAAFSIIAKWQNAKIHPASVAAITASMNALVCLPFALYQHITIDLPVLTLTQCALLFTYAITGIFFFTLFWYRGLNKTSANTAALFTSVMPLSVVVLAVIFLGEKLYWFEIVGMIMIISAIIIGSGRFKSRQARTSAVT
jgi:drug/metabolite transporter (DMT)-like permease